VVGDDSASRGAVSDAGQGRQGGSGRYPVSCAVNRLTARGVGSRWHWSLRCGRAVPVPASLRCGRAVPVPG